jgi:signal transduction histidine kinase
LKTAAKSKTAKAVSSRMISKRAVVRDQGPALPTDWLTENAARFDRMFAAQQRSNSFGQFILSELAMTVGALIASLYVAEGAKFRLIASASTESVSLPEQILKRCVLNLKTKIGQKADETTVLVPICEKRSIKGVMAFSAERPFGKPQHQLLDHAARQFAVVLDMMESDARTQRLLRQSESLTRELQNQQVWLKHTNDSLEEKARMLAVQKLEMETRNREIELARRTLQDKAHQLAVTSRYKSEFLANMSHELRTPLNSMLLLARQLMDNREQTLTPKQLEFAKVINAAGHELLQLVNDILDLAKIEAGKISMEIGNYTPHELPEFVDNNFQLLAQSKDLRLKVELARNVPKVMQTDARRLEQILKNLLSNALKFTKKGSVTLHVASVESGWSAENKLLNEAPSVIAFSVIDTGIGIPAEKQQLIFEAFQQADGSTSREYGGTGLGLTICRELAALLGGEIQLQSEPGKGSTFRLFTPQTTVAPVAPEYGLRESTTRTLPAAELAGDAALINKLRGRTALIVDDDIRNVFALTSLLERFGMTVVSAEEGQAALNLLEQMPSIDIVLMDIMMPGMDGFSAIQKMRRIEKFTKLPIIAVTAKAMKDDREKCLRAGASNYIAKPINPELLLNALKECLP